VQRVDVDDAGQGRAVWALRRHSQNFDMRVGLDWSYGFISLGHLKHVFSEHEFS
jgi:hypothetical protein